MSNITITNIDLGSVVYKDPDFRQGLLTFGGAATVAEGTILARDSVSGNFVPFVIGGTTNQNGIPKAILTYDVTSAGAGNIAIQAMISGVVRKERLIVNADGDGSNITEAILDQLRDYSIVAADVTELNILDNQ